MQYRVFYSWQSDLPNATNRSAILDALEAVAKDIKANNVEIEPVVDRDTAGVAGSPDIGQTIFDKIDNADVFVCDVSIINSQTPDDRPTPNPNVLLELGYALKTHGAKRVVMVMNTAFGPPERLPFDLKQKRVVTYDLSLTAGDRKLPKGELRSKLTAALTAILQAHTKSAQSTQQRSLLDEAIAAVTEDRKDQGRRLRAYTNWLVDELRRLKPDTSGPEGDELLVHAIREWAPLLEGFARLCDAVAAAAARDAARALHKFFEQLLGLYFLPKGFSGSYRETDFDFYKFVGHEAFVVFVAYLIREERWEIINEVLGRALFVENGSHSEPLFEFEALSKHLALLDEVRSNRLAENGQRRVSIQADILKEHFTTEPLSRLLSWDEILDADLLLSLRSLVDSEGPRHRSWWPRTAVYQSSRRPRFLLESKTGQGATTLGKALNLPVNQDLKAKLTAALVKLNAGLARTSMFSDGIHFNSNDIAVKEG